jgi:hypothetical protein
VCSRQAQRLRPYDIVVAEGSERSYNMTDIFHLANHGLSPQLIHRGVNYSEARRTPTSRSS